MGTPGRAMGKHRGSPPTATAADGQARLYVYYKLPPADLGAAVAAARGLQARLCAEHPGLRAELLRRPESPAGQVTVMEAYAADDAAALGTGFQARLAEAAAQAGLPQPRHTELFIGC